MTDTPPPARETAADGSPIPQTRAEARVTQQVSSRAGRNLPVAIGVGVLLGALIVVAHVWRKELFLALATVAVCGGVWEIIQAMRRSGADVPVVPAVLGCAGMMLSAYYGGSEALAVAFLLSCALIMMWRGSDSIEGAAADVTRGFFVAAYPSLLAGFAMLLLAAPDGAWRSFTFMAVTVSSDIGGYAAGVLFGRHPMAPTISPKKSWEGFIGSVLACVAVAIVCATQGLHAPVWVGVLLGVLVACSATVGDLAESTVKRDHGIKDMSSILPGHGGLMDRLDSLVVSAPVVWAVLVVFVPIPGG
ncbi:MAG: phosphatidate cytidylyltransferase [Actinomycetales bacterium]|nr:MAG: phosphatidate cytidylyltransferase [Actinomycetales bacterium]